MATSETKDLGNELAAQRAREQPVARAAPRRKVSSCATCQPKAEPPLALGCLFVLCIKPFLIKPTTATKHAPLSCHIYVYYLHVLPIFYSSDPRLGARIGTDRFGAGYMAERSADINADIN